MTDDTAAAGSPISTPAVPRAWSTCPARTSRCGRRRRRGRVLVSPEVVALLRGSGVPKGDALAVARIAGIQAAKRTPDLVPLCHPIAIHGVTVDLEVRDDAVAITATVRTADRTGVEMEALTCVAVAGARAGRHGEGRGPGRRRHRRPGRGEDRWQASGDWTRDGAVPGGPSARPGHHLLQPRGGWGTRTVRARCSSRASSRSVSRWADRWSCRTATGRGGAAVGDRRRVRPGADLGRHRAVADRPHPRDDAAWCSSERCPGSARPSGRTASRNGIAAAALSRGVAGTAGRTLVVNVPGSPGGARDALAVLGPVLRTPSTSCTEPTTGPEATTSREATDRGLAGRAGTRATWACARSACATGSRGGRARARNAAWLRPWDATSPAGRADQPPTFGHMVRQLAAEARAGRADAVRHDAARATSSASSRSAASPGARCARPTSATGSTRPSPGAASPRPAWRWRPTTCSSIGLHRVEINIRPENAASLRVVEKLGFRDEGLRPRFLHIDGDWRDHLSFALTSDEVVGRPGRPLPPATSRDTPLALRERGGGAA